MKKYKSKNIIDIIPDFLKSPTLENGNIKSQYENEAKEWEKNPLVLRCPQCKSRDLYFEIVNTFKEIPEYRIWCATCNWKQHEPFTGIFSYANNNYPKCKWEEKYQKFMLKRQAEKENLR